MKLGLRRPRKAQLRSNKNSDFRFGVARAGSAPSSFAAAFALLVFNLEFSIEHTVQLIRLTWRPQYAVNAPKEEPCRAANREQHNDPSAQRHDAASSAFQRFTASRIHHRKRAKTATRKSIDQRTAGSAVNAAMRLPISCTAHATKTTSR